MLTITMRPFIGYLMIINFIDKNIVFDNDEVG